MQYSNFDSKTSFHQGETAQGRWQSRHHYQQTRQGYRQSHAYAQAHAQNPGLGNVNGYEVITEINTEDDIIFQVSPDGTVRIIQPLSTHSYSSSRSSC